MGSPEEKSGRESRVPAEIDWEMLDKSRFFFLGAAMFSGVSAVLYPVVVLKTHQQVARPSESQASCVRTGSSVVGSEGLRGLYRGFGTSLLGTVPARALYMGALEVTKSNVAAFAAGIGLSEPASAAIANSAAGLTAATAAQLVWTPVDVVTQRLMVQSRGACSTRASTLASRAADSGYSNGLDAFRKILRTDGFRGLYRGFGISVLTYAPSNAVWWGSYSVAQRLIWAGVINSDDDVSGYRPDSGTIMAVQGASAAVAGGFSAVITMPLDTIKTRLQVLDGGGDENGRRASPTVAQTVRNLVREGGWMACYRGLGPRWASMSMSATTMITTYEFLKRLSLKNPQQGFT